MNYSIGEFSQLTGLSIYTLRYYEQENLIAPNRKKNGHRYYTDADLRWIEFVQRLKDTGMPIKDIQEYAKLRALGDSTMEARMNMLIKHKSALKSQINNLNDHMEKLNDKVQYYENEINNQKSTLNVSN